MLNDCMAVACIPTKDIATARRFYEDVLGLEVSAQDEGGITFLCGHGSRIYLYETEFAGRAGHTLCNFESDHVDDDIAELRRHGVRFETYDALPGVEWEEDVAHMGGMHGVWFRDPDGNVLALFESSDVPAIA